MPDIIVKELPKSEVEISFEVSPEEAKPYLDETAKDISTAKPLPGFRPGKATYEEIRRAYGEMTVWEAALERIVRAFYVRTILEKEIDTVGSPAISVGQLTPGQPIKFTVTAPVEPKVTKFPDFENCQVDLKRKEITDEQVANAVDELRRMRRTEARVDRPATEDDLVIIDLEMKKDRVPVEGGAGRDYRIYLKENQYIPGFAKELVGIKEGDERTFTLPFPEEHYQKHLAGKDVEFTATSKGVFELQLPDANDEFAKTLGLQTIDELRGKLKENITIEENRRADEAAEVEMLEKLANQSSFSEVPEILINEEVRRMMHELQHGVEEQGMKWDDYLSSIKKSANDLRMELIPQAIRRIQTAVLIKQIAKKEGMKVTDQEVDEEVDRILNSLRSGDKETRDRVTSPEYRDYIATQMRNRKVLEWLKEKCIKE
jgi:trigger factor